MTNYVWIILFPILTVCVHHIGKSFANQPENDILQNLEDGLAVQVNETGCVPIDGLCLSDVDLTSYEAIKSLHTLLDDDMSGEIDMDESVDFLKEELTITDGYNSRQSNLHHNSDRYISVQDLWHMWEKSGVHNWTVEETVEWLTETVQLPQYSQAFHDHAINGSYLPRLATSKSNYLGSVLGIKGLSHRTKVTVKAMDAVLFGPPKGSRIKDILIAALVTVIVIGLGYIIHRNHRMMSYHTTLITQIEDLQVEEVKYRQQLQKIKEQATEDSVQGKTGSEIPDSGVGVDSVSDVSGGSAEYAVATNATDHYYDDSADSNGSVTPPNDNAYMHLDRASLEHWLRVTYHKEKTVLDTKRKQAQGEIVKATDICNKLRAQGKNPLNLFSLMHGKMDNVEKTISRARAGMQEVQRDEKERQERWGEIERLLDCNIRRLADLQNIMGSISSLQTNPGDTSNIDYSRGGGSVRSTTSSNTTTGRGYASQLPPVSTVSELSRFEDDTESVGVPRCSSFGSNSTRLLTSASHQQLPSDVWSDSLQQQHQHSSRAAPPQKRPRRQKAYSSASKPVAVVNNGLLPSVVSTATLHDNVRTPVGHLTTPAAAPTEHHTTDEPPIKAAGFTMGGSPLVLPSPTTAPTPVTVTTDEGVKVHGVTSSASEPFLSAKISASNDCKDQPSSAHNTTSSTPNTTNSASSHHRILSQLSPNDSTTGLFKSSPNSKMRTKKKSLFERLTGSRKSLNRGSSSKS